MYTMILTYIFCFLIIKQIYGEEISEDFISTRIIDGIDDNAGLFSAGDRPYIVSLQINSNHICAGSLIDFKTIVTAAHCVKLVQNKTSIKAVGGIVKPKNFGKHRQERNVAKVFIHPEGNPSNDIAVITTDESFKMSEFVHSVYLPPTSYKTAGLTGTISGWGATEEDGPISNRLQSAKVKIMSQEACRYYYGDDVETSWLCATSTFAHEDACNGDSGGPLVCGENYLCGIISSGLTCGYDENPGIYIRVSSFVDWIIKIKNNEKYNYEIVV